MEVIEAIDFRKDPVYKATESPKVVDVPSMLFVMVDGHGAPEALDSSDTEFHQAMQILYGIVFTIKFWDKKYLAPPDYAKFTNAPVEGLWWTKDGTQFDLNQPDKWEWTTMLRVPEFVTPEYYKEVVGECISKKQNYMYSKARLEHFTEGMCVQLLHIGPYNQEGPNIERLHKFATDSGYSLVGKHHELYFGDPRRSAPEKLKTILRQPVKKYRYVM